MQVKHAALLLSALVLTACGSTPGRKATVENARPGAAPAVAPATLPTTDMTPGKGGYLAGDGPGKDVPANLADTPDAVPKDEPLHPYANRPYVALGNNYAPLTETGKYKARGVASWYGKKFHGQPTSSGEPYDMYKMTAAHPTLPIPSYARVTNTRSGQVVIVRVNDRGPFLHDRIMDLSYAAATKLGVIGSGTSEIEVESISVDNYQPPLVHASGRAFALAGSEPISSAPLPPSAPAAPPVEPMPVVAGEGGDHFLQLGAFRSPESAESFRAKMQSGLNTERKNLSLYSKNDGLVRVQIGPYPSDAAARAAAEKLESQLGFKPLVSKR